MRFAQCSSCHSWNIFGTYYQTRCWWIELGLFDQLLVKHWGWQVGCALVRKTFTGFRWNNSFQLDHEQPQVRHSWLTKCILCVCCIGEYFICYSQDHSHPLAITYWWLNPVDCCKYSKHYSSLDKLSLSSYPFICAQEEQQEHPPCRMANLFGRLR